MKGLCETESPAAGHSLGGQERVGEGRILQLEKRKVMDDMGTWGGSKQWLEGVLLASMEPCWGFCG